MNMTEMSDAKLITKMIQAWDMAGLVRIDGDRKNEERRTKEAREYQAELIKRGN